jgi:arylsulfatase A
LMFSSRGEKDECQIVKQPVKREELTDLYLKRFEKNIQDSIVSEKPFFMFMSFAQAHIDCQTKTFFSNPEFLQDTEHYKASINEMDYMVGEIYNTLKNKNLLNNTLIIFTSDNGAQYFNKTLEDEFPAYQGSNGPFSGTWSAINQNSFSTGKCSTWEGGMRVPGFLVWEGREDIIKPGTFSYQIYSSMDLLPTILNLTNQNIPNNIDGKNMLENLYSNEITNRFIHFYRGGAFYALRYGKWKFHLVTRPGEECGFVWYMFPMKYPPMEHESFLIFDLNQDPGERNPIKLETFIKHYPKIYEEVLQEIKSHKESMKNSPSSLLEEVDDNTKVCCDRSKDCFCS